MNQADAIEELKVGIQAEIAELSDKITRAINDEKDCIQAGTEALDEKLAKANNTTLKEKPSKR